MIVAVGAGSTERAVPRLAAHRAPGILHVAVSLQVIDPGDGRWLLQRRSSAKQLFSLHWANTCCTHPAPGESPRDAVVRRANEELGLAVDGVRPAGVFTYRAVDPSSGLVEYERDHVYVAYADTMNVDPDPDEISELTSLPFSGAMGLVESDNGAPWAAEVLRRSAAAIRM